MTHDHLLTQREMDAERADGLITLTAVPDASEYPAKQVGAVINAYLRGTGSQGPRRTRREAAAERLVDAIAVLIEEGVEADDVVAFEDARAAAESYRQAEITQEWPAAVAPKPWCSGHRRSQHNGKN